MQRLERLWTTQMDGGRGRRWRSPKLGPCKFVEVTQVGSLYAFECRGTYKKSFDKEIILKVLSSITLNSLSLFIRSSLPLTKQRVFLSSFSQCILALCIPSPLKSPRRILPRAPLPRTPLLKATHPRMTIPTIKGPRDVGPIYSHGVRLMPKTITEAINLVE